MCGGAGGGGAGAIHTLGNIKTDSAPCALIKKTIKSDHKPVFNTLPVFLSPQTWIYSLQARATAGAAAPEPSRPCLDAVAKMRKALAILECLHGTVGVR